MHLHVHLSSIKKLAEAFRSFPVIGISLLLSFPFATFSRASGYTWEELSRQAAREGDYARALDYLRRLDLKKQSDPAIRAEKVTLLLKLGQDCYERKEYSQAEGAFSEVLNLDPDNFSAFKALGYIAYYSQRLEEARGYWERAVSLNPDDLQLIRQKEHLEKELRVENKLDSTFLANFDIRFHSGAGDYHISDIQTYLQQAYQEVGGDFNYYPSRSLVVILYQREEFEQLRASPEWLGGLYDGKIRLPVPEGKWRAEDFKKILWHEYTHALIHDLARNHCPVWLQEGLAQHEEAKIVSPSREALANAWENRSLIPLSRLDDSFSLSQSAGVAALAYAQAFSLTEFLITTYGFWKINQILERLKSEGDWSSAVEKELFLSADEMEAKWKEHLAGEYGS